LTTNTQDIDRCNIHGTLLVGPICCPTCSECFLAHLDTVRVPQVRDIAFMEISDIQRSQNEWLLRRMNAQSSEG
jgi:hypothetical protein